MSFTQIIKKVFEPRQKALEKHQSGGEALQRAVLEHSIVPLKIQNTAGIMPLAISRAMTNL